MPFIGSTGSEESIDPMCATRVPSDRGGLLYRLLFVLIISSSSPSNDSDLGSNMLLSGGADITI